MTKNAFEIRLDVLALAKDLLDKEKENYTTDDLIQKAEDLYKFVEKDGKGLGRKQMLTEGRGRGRGFRTGLQDGSGPNPNCPKKGNSFIQATNEE